MNKTNRKTPMANPNPKTKIKRLVSLVLLAQIIAISGSSSVSASFSFFGRSAAPDTYAAEQGLTVSQSISLTDSNEFLRYLKRLDTDSGRVAFGKSLQDIQTEKANLQRIHDNLVFLVTQTTLSRLNAQRLEAESTSEPLLPAAPLENPSISDLVLRIQGELRIDALLNHKIELSQALDKLLESNSALSNLSVFESLSIDEQETLGLLEKNAQGSNLPLLSRLRFDASMTDFWLYYATKGSSLLADAKANAAQDVSFLDSKATREQSVLDLIQTLYPTEADQKAQILSDEALDLFRIYEKESVPEVVSRLENAVTAFDQIVSDLNSTFSFDALDDFPSRARVLREILETLKTDPIPTVQFEAQSQEYLALPVPMSGADLSSDDFMLRQWEVLNDFEKLLLMGKTPNHNEGIEQERSASILVENEERVLKREVSAIPPAPVILPPAETSPSVTPETQTPTEETPATTPEAQPVVSPSAPTEIQPEAAPAVTLTPAPEAPAPEAPIQPIPNSETVAPSSANAVPVEVPVAPLAPQGNLIKDVSDQVPVLGPVMKILDVVTNPAQTLLATLTSAGTPSTPTPSEEPLKAAAPTEVSPTETVHPATEAPTTEVPATEIPAVIEPTAPVPETPVTEIPAIAAPTTEIPVETAPTTETPATEIPAVEVPATPTPVPEILAPVTEAPATEVPAVETPAVVQPVVPAPETPAPVQNLPSLQEVSQGIQDFFSDALAVSSAIAQDAGINTVNQALEANAKTESLAMRIKGLLDQVDALKVKPSDFKKILDSFSLSTDQLDELTSFLNQTTLKLGLADKTEAFNGKNGVLRFGTDICPDLAKAKVLTPENEKEGFFDLSSSRQNDLLLKEKGKESDPDYLRLKTLRKLDADFCFSVSDDISTKNLIGRADYARQSRDSVSIDDKDIGLRFENDPSRSLTLSLGQGESAHSVVLSHSSSNEEPAVAPVAQKADDKLVDVSVAPVASTDNPLAYSLSTLENPDRTLASMDISQREALQRVVTYEQNSHRKNSVTLFTDDAHLANPRTLDEHTIYNFGTGLESETLSFTGAILRALPDGTIEGYTFDPVAARREILASAPIDNPLSEDQIQVRLQEVISQIHDKGMVRPDFIISQPFALDKDSNLIDGLGTEIIGDATDQLSLILNVDPALYPIVLHTRISITSLGQTSYDSLLHWDEGASARFGSSVAIGDFNGDGKKDVAIGLPLADNSQGKVAIYYSVPTTSLPEGEPDTVINGEALSHFGSRLWSGDLNGDGIDDLAVGSPGFEDGRGRVWIFHDSLASMKEQHTVLSAENADLRITGSGAADEFGTSLVFADFTNDGKNDLAISSPGASNSRGSVSVFENSALLKGGSLNAEEGVLKFSGEGNEGGRFGTSLATLDYDHDGTQDLAVGAPGTGTSVNPDIGRAYVFFQDTIPWTHHDTPCLRNCSAENADLVFEGESSGSRFGSAISGGDLNNDGQDDLAISADHFSLTDTMEEGRVYVFLSDCGSQIADCKLKIGDSKEGPISAREADLKIIGQPGDHLGHALLAFDSRQDSGLVLGDRDCDGNAGCAFVYFNPTLTKLVGKDNGFTDANASNDLKWEGSALNQFSESLAARDFDGDGFTDFVFGAPELHDSDGAATVFRGKFMSAYVVKPVDRGPSQPIPVEELKPVAEETTEAPPVPETKPPEFNLQIQDITQAVQETANPEFALDISAPDMPVISCPGFESGIASPLTQAVCSWSDTSGPSMGTFRYCVDTTNTCIPEAESSDRTAETGALTNVHTYLRAQTEDLGGKSEIASFDLVFNHAPVVTVGPSDGGSDVTNPTLEGGRVEFSMTATDAEQNPYTLLVCRADSTPLYNEKIEPTCPGPTSNLYCMSKWTDSGKEAKCSFDVSEEPTQTLIWYAFACDKSIGAGDCSPALQGQGIDGSPVYIRHPQSFGKVTVTDTQGESIEPGDHLRFVLPHSEMKDMPKGSKVTLHICSAETQLFDYVSDECVGGTLVCSSPATDPELGGVSCDEAGTTLLTPVPTPSGEKDFQVYVEHGDHGLADGPHLQKYTVTDVRPTLINYINEATADVPVGGTAPVQFSAVFSDPNGAQDILGANGVLFDASTTDDNCSADENNCYHADSCTVIPLNGTDARADCTVAIGYSADAGNQWKAHMHVIDIQGEYTDFPDSESGAEVPALAAINQSDVAIPYTLTTPGEVSKAVPFVLTNLGNQPVDVLISGTDLVGNSGTIPADYQRWSLVPDFDYAKEGIPLSTFATVGGTAQEGCADLNLKIHDEDLTESQDVTLYWKVLIPKNQKADLYKGTVSFNQTEDGCKPLDLSFNPPSHLVEPEVTEPVVPTETQPALPEVQPATPAAPTDTVVPAQTVEPAQTVAPAENVVPVQ